jgi:hypothetical protein
MARVPKDAVGGEVTHRSRYKQGKRLPPTPYQEWIRERCEWAARQVLVKAQALRVIRWVWVRGIKCKDGDGPWDQLYGRVFYAKKGTTIAINVRGDEGHQFDTAIHEYAHALLEPLEGLRQRGDPGTQCLDHTAAWAALYGSMYAWAVDMSNSGPQEPQMESE